MLPIRSLHFSPWFWSLAVLTLTLLLAFGVATPVAFADETETTTEDPAPKSPEPDFPAEESLADLPNGNYQLCSEPDPHNWQDGAGVCFNFAKQDSKVDGYYGYPHSSEFVCLRGQLEQNAVVEGIGRIAIWGGLNDLQLSPGEFVWDREQRLRLATAEQHFLSDVTTETLETETRWLLFRHANLDLTDFHRYPFPRMKRPAELCDWNQ